MAVVGGGGEVQASGSVATLKIRNGQIAALGAMRMGKIRIYHQKGVQ